jgi:hypothetical protein
MNHIFRKISFFKKVCVKTIRRKKKDKRQKVISREAINQIDFYIVRFEDGVIQQNVLAGEKTRHQINE